MSEMVTIAQVNLEQPMAETYRDLPGYVGIYTVSDYGNVRSLDRKVNGRQIRGQLIKQGCAGKTKKVNLCTGTRCISKTHTVAQLVLITFIGPRPDGMEARHIDTNEGNNHLNNLYWGPHCPNSKSKGQP